MFVHHLRKVRDLDDPFNDISGSTGIAGAADTMLILSRSRNEKNANLIVSGRDVNYQEFSLNFDNCNWKLDKIKTTAEIEQEQIPNFILNLCDFIFQKTEWTGTATELITSMGDTETPPNVVSKYLGRFSNTYLASNGIIYKTKKSGKRYIYLQYIQQEQ